MQYLRRNPLVIWTKWWLRTRKTLKENKEKYLKIGHLSYLNNVTVGNYNTIYDNVILHQCNLGNFVYIQDNSLISNASIGNFCSIGPHVRIGPGMHPVHYLSTHPAFYSTKLQCQLTFSTEDSFKESGYVRIGNDVWIGANALIMDDISIADGAVIAAGAVVTKDVDPYMIVGGVPAAPIKQRFNDDEISKLLEFKWWDKDLSWLRDNYKLFQDPPSFFNCIEDLSKKTNTS
ncbi:MAG TPA: CatB-related O-acetyltransferase [Lentimicrobium sp.]|nr:CatB-related O-acetyltransferase [Lentimicrobium sp.]